MNYQGNFVTLDTTTGNLQISITPAGREYLEEMRTDDRQGFTQSYDAIWSELVEDIRCNSSIDFIRPEEIGALTSAPIIAMEIDRDDQGNLISTGDVYWFEAYQVLCEFSELLEGGSVVFVGAK